MLGREHLHRPADGDCVETAGPGGKERSALPCPNGLSLDRSSAPESLVASRAAPGDGDSRTLLWRYSLSRDSARPGLLATDSSGTAVTSEAYESRASGVRGVLSHRTHPFSPPDWYLGRPADEGTHHCWGDGTGSLSYWQETGEIWSLSGRMLFALPLSSVDREMR